MKVRFLLKKKGKKNEGHPIYLALYQNDEIELIYTKERCKSKDWNTKERCPKDHNSNTYIAIDKVKREVQKAIQLLQSQDKVITAFGVKQQYLNQEKFKNEIQQKKDLKSKEGLNTISKLADEWVKNSLFKYKSSTQKAVNESINQFKTYLKKIGQLSLLKKDLTPAIISSYEKYLQEVKKLSNSTHGKRMKHLRWFLKSIDYDVKNIQIRTFKKEIIALTLDELRLLESVDVSSKIELQKAKDMFLLGCYTGLRISDLKRINETRLIDNTIKMILQKNQKEVTIPLRPETREILERYNFSSPKISEPQLNEYIKIVCDTAGINKEVTIKSNKAGKDVESRIKKYKLITSHTASKTFITLAPQRFGLTPPEIAAIVGKDLKTLINHYFQLPLETAIKKMINTENTL